MDRLKYFSYRMLKSYVCKRENDDWYFLGNKIFYNPTFHTNATYTVGIYIVGIFQSTVYLFSDAIINLTRIWWNQLLGTNSLTSPATQPFTAPLTAALIFLSQLSRDYWSCYVFFFFILRATLTRAKPLIPFYHFMCKVSSLFVRQKISKGKQ